MTPPIVRRRSANPIQIPPPPPPKAEQPVEAIKIQSNSPLVKLIQSTGRTPTHPLTAKMAR